MDVDDQQECQYVSEGVPAYRWRIKFFVGAHSCTFYVFCVWITPLELMRIFILKKFKKIF